jgi:ribosomal protein S14
MNLWGWVIAYVVGFSLLQVLIYRYLRGRGDGGAGDSASEHAIERTTPPHERWNTEGRSTVGDPPHGADPLYASKEVGESEAATPEGRHCPRCGALNAADGAFSYCRKCVRPLG